MKSQAAWGLRALVRHQFRFLKWVLVVNMVVCVLACLLLTMQYQDALDAAWAGSQMGYHSETGLNYIIWDSCISLLICQLLITPMMALWQQWEAYQPSNALMMASLPPSRVEQLGARWLSGALCYTLPLLIVGIYAAACRGVYGGELAVFAKMSPFAREIARQDTLLTILAPLLRIWLLVTSVYAITNLISSLYGNPMVSLAMMGALVAWASVVSVNLYDYCVRVGYMFAPNQGVLIHTAILRALRSVLFIEVGQAVTDGARLQMPWQGLGVFVGFHGLLIGGCLWGAYRLRVRLAVEELGRVFLFRASRVAVVCVLTLWPLLIAPSFLITWNERLMRNVYNPMFPYALIPALLVFAVGWLVLVRKRGKVGRRVVAAVLCACLVSGNLCGGARAEEEELWAKPLPAFGQIDVTAQYAPERLALDQELTGRLQKLGKALAEAIGEGGGMVSSNRNAYYDYREMALIIFKANNLSIPEFRDLHDVNLQFSDRFIGVVAYTDASVIGMLSGALEEQGYPLLATELRRGVDTLTQENGVYLSVMRGNDLDWYDDDEVYGSLLEIRFYAPVPLRVREAEAVMTAVEQSRDMRRSWVYSNGDVDTMIYTFMRERYLTGFYDWETKLTIAMEDGKTAIRVKLSYMDAKDDQHRNATLSALARAMVTSMKVSEADAQAVQGQMEELIKNGRTGRSTSDSVKWSVRRAGGESFGEYRISIDGI